MMTGMSDETVQEPINFMVLSPGSGFDQVEPFVTSWETGRKLIHDGEITEDELDSYDVWCLSLERGSFQLISAARKKIKLN